ncbi:MAG: protein kinase [Sandaracinaceae bacterium]|nr:protein kinase [Sandaracinaceae bacterium]
MPILTERERIGTKLEGKYELDAILGTGGMGTVYVGRHAWTGRRVAVKVLKPSYAENEDVVKRFLREARAAAALHHPNVVDVLDMGRTDDGAVYMVLELLEGDSLGSLLRRDGKMSATQLLPVLVPIAEALSEVHARGFVHRDLKPDNIFVATLRGRKLAKLLDFGIAKALDDPDSSTRTGAIMGTAYYMSPEQASGRPDVGPPTDVWALGVVLYEALSGVPPYTADSATGVLVKILTTPPAPIPRDVPEVLASIVQRAMQGDPAARFADMRAMASALREAARSLGVALPDPVALEIRTPEEIVRASLEPADPRMAAARAATVPSVEPYVPSSLETLPREAPRKAVTEEPAPPASAPAPVSISTGPISPPPTHTQRWVIGGLAAAVVLLLVFLVLERAPWASAPTTSAPTGTVPTGTVPTGTVPTGTVPTGTVPTGTVPTGTVPTGTVPTGTVPTGTVPTGTVPTGTVPTGTVPTGTVPTGTVPTGTVPTGVDLILSIA